MQNFLLGQGKAQQCSVVTHSPSNEWWCGETTIDCVVLFDDLFVTAETYEKCLETYLYLVSLLRSLGFRIKWKKVIDPTHELVFLGIRINTVSGRVSLDPVKTEEITTLLDSTLKRRRMSKSKIQLLAGKLSCASNVIV